MSGSSSGPLPDGMRLDPLIDQSDATFWHWVVDEDGRRTAWQGEDHPMICPVCLGDPEKMPDCAECVGRGVVLHIPFADRPWDEVFPNLWLGGHDCQPSDARPNGECFLEDEDFSFVVSLYQRNAMVEGEWAADPRYQPRHADHIFHRMSDAELDPAHHTIVDDLAQQVVDALLAGEKILVRCQAGLNRSSLIVALALMKIGSSAGAAIEHLRETRSPYVLCNESFVQYLYDKEKQDR